MRGDIIDEIKRLPKNNLYHHSLNSIEQMYENGILSEEIALDKAVALTCDYRKNKSNVIESVLNNQRIFIIDAIMGSGKTTFILDKLIPDNRQDKFICVLPTLEECTRYKDSLKGKVPIEVYEPKAIGGRKLKGLQDLLGKNVNIVTTHALIQKIDEETMSLLEKTDYMLIIDECLNVVQEFNKHFNDVDLKDLERLGYVIIDEQGFLTWNETENAADYDGRYEDVKALCNLRSLMKLKIKDSYSDSILMWNFPIKFFDLFKKCYICTYLWDGSLQKAYFDLHGIDYMHMTLLKGNLSIYNPTKEYLLREDVFSLINLYDGKLNKIGEPDRYNKNPLSSSWYKGKARNNKTYLEIVKKNTENYFKNIVKTSSSENMFTVFKNFKKYVKGSGYTKGFVSCNAKATNDFKNKTSLAYLINHFIKPNIANFFSSYGVEVNKELYSVSELLQWIWRSAIREGKEINLYIPSERMRNLLIQWSKGQV